VAIPVGFGGRDYPDFGVSGLENTQVTITDMSELAVRLGSINRFDRTGVVIFEEGFQYGIGRWIQNSSAEDNYVVPSANYFSIVPYAALLATTDDLNVYSGIYTRLPIPYTSSMGFEWHVKFYDEAMLFYFWVQLYTGSVEYRVVFRIDVEDKRIDILAKDEKYHIVYTDELNFGSDSPFHVFKVVVDFVNEIHIRMVIDGVDVDLTDYPIWTDTEDTSPHLYLYFSNNPGPSTINRIYLDNIIITMDEPT